MRADKPFLTTSTRPTKTFSQTQIKSRTENVNKNLTFSSDTDEPIILFARSTIELINWTQKTRITFISIYSAVNKFRFCSVLFIAVNSFISRVNLHNCEHCYYLVF